MVSVTLAVVSKRRLVVVVHHVRTLNQLFAALSVDILLVVRSIHIHYVFILVFLDVVHNVHLS